MNTVIGDNKYEEAAKDQEENDQKILNVRASAAIIF